MNMGSGELWIGQPDDDGVRRALEGGEITAESGWRHLGTAGEFEVTPENEAVMVRRGGMDITLTLDLCSRCRGPLIIINGKIQGQATFRLADGDVKITPHRLPCTYPGTSW